MGTEGTGRAGGTRPLHSGLNRAAALARCSHPEPVVVVTAVASLLAATAGRGPGTLWLTGAIFTGQLSVGWSNDWLDRRLDTQAQRQNKPLVAGTVPPHVVGYAALAAFAASLPLSFAYGVAAGAVHVVALACAFVYNLGLKATPAGILPYAAAFGLLPVIVTLGLSPSRLPPAWAIAAGALLGCGGHFAQVLGDIPTDRRLGFRGLPHLLGRQWSAVTAAALLLVATVLVTFGPQPAGPLQLAALGLAAVFAAGIVAAARIGRLKVAYLLLLCAAVVAVLGFATGGRSL